MNSAVVNNYPNRNLNSLNLQINQMINSETFKKIFREIESSKEYTQDSQKKHEFHNLIDFDAILN